MPKPSVPPPPSSPTSMLTNLEIKAASMVDVGDNPPADIVALKSHGHEAPSKWDLFMAKVKKMVGMDGGRTTDQILAQRRFNERFWQAKDAYTDSVYEISATMGDDPSSGAKLRESTEQFIREATDLTNALADTDINALKAKEAVTALKSATEADEITEEFIEAVDALKALEPAGDVDDSQQNEEADMPKGENTFAIEGLSEKASQDIATLVAKSAAEAAAAAVTEALKGSQPPADEPKPDAPNTTGLDEATKTYLKSMEARVKAAEDATKAMEEDRALETIAKRVAAFGPTGLEESVDDLAKQIRDMEQTHPEMAKKFEQNLKAMAEQRKIVAKTLGQSYGVTPSANGEPTLEEKVEITAKEFRKDDPTLTEAQARAKAWKVHKRERSERIAEKRLRAV